MINFCKEVIEVFVNKYICIINIRVKNNLVLDNKKNKIKFERFGILGLSSV